MAILFDPRRQKKNREHPSSRSNWDTPPKGRARASPPQSDPVPSDESHGAVQALLCAFRDGLPPEMAIGVGARLPYELRLLFFDGWDPITDHSAYSRRTPLLYRFTGPQGQDAEEAERMAHALHGLLHAVFDESDIQRCRQRTIAAGALRQRSLRT